MPRPYSPPSACDGPTCTRRATGRRVRRNANLHAVRSVRRAWRPPLKSWPWNPASSRLDDADLAACTRLGDEVLTAYLRALDAAAQSYAIAVSHLANRLDGGPLLPPVRPRAAVAGLSVDCPGLPVVFQAQSRALCSTSAGAMRGLRSLHPQRTEPGWWRGRLREGSRRPLAEANTPLRRVRACGSCHHGCHWKHKKKAPRGIPMIEGLRIENAG